jgi:hypothetical protein
VRGRKLTLAAGEMHLELFPERIVRICHTHETLAAGRFRSIPCPTVQLARFPCLQPRAPAAQSANSGVLQL